MSSNLEKALGFNLEAFNYLYVLCDYETLLKKNITLENFLEILKKYDVKLLQYRDKVSDLELQKQNLIFLKQNLNIPIIVNDKVELIDYADGLHVGQDDVLKINKDKKLAIKLLRKRVKNKLLSAYALGIPLELFIRVPSKMLRTDFRNFFRRGAKFTERRG